MKTVVVVALVFNAVLFIAGFALCLLLFRSRPSAGYQPIQREPQGPPPPGGRSAVVRPRLVVVCSRGCADPRRDKEQEHPGMCVCGGYLTDEPEAADAVARPASSKAGLSIRVSDEREEAHKEGAIAPDASSKSPASVFSHPRSRLSRRRLERPPSPEE
jgi:hypothetical protein